MKLNYIKSQSSVKPDLVDTTSSKTTVYIRQNIIEKEKAVENTSEDNATTYYCDGLWFNNSQVDYACVGGGSGNPSFVGTLCSHLACKSSLTYWNFGAALSCKPLATT